MLYGKYDRRHTPTTTQEPGDKRSPAQKDRDRLIYAWAFRRLADITQVVSAENGPAYHNRLTHSLKVAQVARRLAEKFLRELPKKPRGEVIQRCYPDPDVVEAAALAHDLGHPPFGHTGEEELNRLARQAGLKEGFEGNAQSFRIVAKLAQHKNTYQGLDLTRATLRAMLKYPRKWVDGERKYGTYDTEQADFDFAFAYFPGDSRKSVEAELMDYADDIAYAVHDVEDFYTAGWIPLDRLANKQTREAELGKFFDEVFKRRRAVGTQTRSKYDEKSLQGAFRGVLEFIRYLLVDRESGLASPYTGRIKQHGPLRYLVSQLTERYANSIRLNCNRDQHNEPLVIVESSFQMELEMLKELTWHYVIYNPSLQLQQSGERHVINQLFNFFYEAASANQFEVFPPFFQDYVRYWAGNDAEKKRAVVDCIAMMTEQQALIIHQRLLGLPTAPFSGPTQ